MTNLATAAKKTSLRLAWATDTHLDHIVHEPAMFRAFVNSILKTHNAKGLLLTGDISNGHYLEEHLKALHRGLGASFPIWYVCGNHDYYHGSIEQIRKTLRTLESAIPELCWLGDTTFVPVGIDTALVGHDGWYDGLYSPIANSRLLMNDFFHIKELSGLHSFRSGYPVVHVEGGPLHLKMQSLAQEGADHIRMGVKDAIANGYENILIATHVAPFPQNSLYKGKQSDEDWMPFFSSKIMGETILDLVDANPSVKFRVLCGHNHHKATFTAFRENLVCDTGTAAYGYPAVEQVIEL